LTATCLCLPIVGAFQPYHPRKSTKMPSLHAIIHAGDDDTTPYADDTETATVSTTTTTRHRFLLDGCRRLGLMMTATAVGGSCGSSVCFPAVASAKSYSENAKNLERINAGDFSGGAVYNNNPSTDGAKRRRAMTGCKTPIAREEAAEVVLNKPKLSEKECNTMVLNGDTEFMLQALRNLECPTCPYGISSSRR